jgi:hypothetical protein
MQAHLESRPCANDEVSSGCHQAAVARKGVVGTVKPNKEE